MSKFKIILHQSIALETLYKSSFETKLIRRIVGAENREKWLGVGAIYRQLFSLQGIYGLALGLIKLDSKELG